MYNTITAIRAQNKYSYKPSFGSCEVANWADRSTPETNFLGNRMIYANIDRGYTNFLDNSCHIPYPQRADYLADNYFHEKGHAIKNLLLKSSLGDIVGTYVSACLSIASAWNAWTSSSSVNMSQWYETEADDLAHDYCGYVFQTKVYPTSKGK